MNKMNKLFKGLMREYTFQLKKLQEKLLVEIPNFKDVEEDGALIREITEKIKFISDQIYNTSLKITEEKEEKSNE